MIAQAEAVLSPMDIPERDQRELVEMYRAALLQGSEAQLVSPTGESRTLPAGVYNLLVQILKDLSEGNSIAIFQDRQGLTTVQASKFLGMSRQFLVNLLQKGEIPFHRVGTHRRIYLADLLSYKDRRDKSRRAVLEQMVRSEVEAGAYDIIPDDVRAD